MLLNIILNIVRELNQNFYVFYYVTYKWLIVISRYFSNLYFKLDHIPRLDSILLVSIFLDLNLQSKRLIVITQYLSESMSLSFFSVIIMLITLDSSWLEFAY